MLRMMGAWEYAKHARYAYMNISYHDTICIISICNENYKTIRDQQRTFKNKNSDNPI